MDIARTAVRDDDPSEAVVTVCGEIDIATCDQLCEGLNTAITLSGVKTIVVDLTQTQFMDSSGVKALVQGRQAAQTAGIDYRITGAARQVRRVLEVTGVLDFLQGDTSIDRLRA